MSDSRVPVERLVRNLTALENAYSPGHHGRWSARRRADLVDEAVAVLADGLGPTVALVALGGYGRGQLCPRSDVDLMVLHRGEYPDALFETASRVFYPFWDAGIPLGHAVRTVEESIAGGQERIDVLTALVDARLVSGDPQLFGHLRSEVSRAVTADRARYLELLRAAAAERRSRYGSCSQLLEPDLKESAGGLRDIHFFGWAGAALGADSLADLAAAGLLREREVAALDEAEEFFVRLRSALHLESARRTDRVHMELQPRLAEAFGFDAVAGMDAPDALMRALFEHARAVEHVAEAFLDRYRAAAPGGGTVTAEAERPAGPEAVLRAFARMGETGTPLGPGALDALEGSLVGVPRWTDGMREAFLTILRAGEDGVRALEAMDRAGLLSRFLPEWEPVRCRPQRDPYHRFSVDVHLLRATAEAARILAGDTADDPLAREAAAAISDRDAVLLGAFLHDIGKVGEGSHVPRGVQVAASVLSRMSVPDPTAASVLFLVQQHLLLSDTATRRDIADEDLVIDVAARIQDPERLAMLYVLTAADARATGPHAWTPWRQALVRELAAKVERVLRREMGPDRAALLSGRLEEVRTRLRGENVAAVKDYLERLSRPYILSTEPTAIARDFPLMSPPIGRLEVRTRAGRGEREGTYEVTVVARDRPGLLSSIAGAMAVNGMNILSARAFTTDDGVALDPFVVEPAFRGVIDEERWRRFRTDLRHVLEGRISLDRRLAEKRTYYPSPSADVPVEVNVDNRVSDFYTVVEVSAPDRIGLLHDLARVFHDLDLDVHLAVVATYGVRVVDAFYVRDLVGEKVVEPDRIAAIEATVKARLNGGGP